MITTYFEKHQDWLDARMGKITGSKLGDVISDAGITKTAIMEELTMLGVEFKKSAKVGELEAMLPEESRAKLLKQLPKKQGFYQLIAERLAIPEAGDLSSNRDRGNFLEEEAILRFQEESGKQIDMRKQLWAREDNECIAYSPDGVISESEAVEAKCLSAAHHIEALLTQKIPKEYEKQIMQAFVVNDKLQTLYMLFFDPRMLVKNFFYLTIHRNEAEVQRHLELERLLLEEVNMVANQLLMY